MVAGGGGEEKRHGGGWAARRRERLGTAAEAPGAAPEPGGGAEAGEGVGGPRGPSSGDGSGKCRLKRQLIGPSTTSHGQPNKVIAYFMKSNQMTIIS